MTFLILGLIPVALLISLVLTAALVRFGHRMGTLDSAPMPGQVKFEHRPVPNTGGVAIFWAISVPLLAGLALTAAIGDATVETPDGPGLIPTDLRNQVEGITSRMPMALGLWAAMLVLHVMGLVDDRRPLGPWLKLGVMTLCAGSLIVLFPDTRLVTMLDAYAGGSWASIAITILWFLVVTNALNFMDNMDGLSGGVTVVAAGCFLATTLIGDPPQWFIGAMLALLVGAVLGFLAFNRPPAKIFMGDGGSLVIGFLLAFLTVRTTYYAPEAGHPAGAWYAVLAPLVILAVPLYDLTAVTAVRLSQGKSPFVGDLQHLSHRLVKRGLSKPAAVGVICGLAGITGLSGVLLPVLPAWGAVLVGVQVFLTLAVLAAYERASSPAVTTAREPAP